MGNFKFKTTAETELFCLRIRDALIEFFDLQCDEAVSMINEYWNDLDSIEEEPLLLHEAPYYYAMCIGHHPKIGDGIENWEKDQRWWPPPESWRKF